MKWKIQSPNMIWGKLKPHTNKQASQGNVSSNHQNKTNPNTGINKLYSNLLLFKTKLGLILSKNNVRLK